MLGHCQRFGVRHAALAMLAAGFALLPNTIAHQDMGSYIARKSGIDARWRAHIATPGAFPVFTASLAFPKPIDPRDELPFKLASVDRDLSRIYGAPSYERRLGRPAESEDGVFPTVNRGAKGDRAPIFDPTGSLPQHAPVAVPDTEGSPGQKLAPAVIEPDADPAFKDYELKPATEHDLAPVPEDKLVPLAWLVPEGNGALPAPSDHVEGVLALPVRLAALQNPLINRPVSAAVTPPETSVAPKGEVTGAEQTPKSPAERLKLTGEAFVKAHKCLTQAIYFESRAEPERGQQAVAQVVMNRVFSGFYPGDVCETVFQNAQRYLACQFTFACEGKKLIVKEPEAWALASRIATDTLEGRIWLPEIGKATHYHATYVRPSWIREMATIKRIGVHIFYRPRNWGPAT